MIAGVLVEISNKNVDRIFDYKVPFELESSLKIGIRVEVPFGYQMIEGFVLEIKNNSNLDELKEIKRIVDKDIILNDELLLLGKKMKSMTLTTLINCYQTMLPKALKASKKTNINKKYDIYYKLDKTKIPNKLNKTQQQIIDSFREKDEISKKALKEISPSSLNTLVKNEILIEIKKEHYRLEYQNENSLIKKLTPLQEKVVESVSLKKYQPYLLHGVTGSGKTEVYIKLIEKVLEEDKTAIMLVPEISLTPQMISRFEEVFGKKIAALHSALSDGEKYDEWRRIAKKEVKIVIGARSAIFAPLQKLGIIIIDEEHSDSYKQDNNPRYNAKDIALLRGKYNNCPVILGSATPTLEDYAKASKGLYSLLVMNERVNKKELPKIDIIDMNYEMKRSIGHFSKPLIESIEKVLAAKNQVILLLNRRGYSSVVSCKNCGYTVKCPNCDITLTYHKTSNILRCHYCSYATKLDSVCPECKEEAMKTLGVGTEKIEEELQKIFKDAKILRMDIDTTNKKGSHRKMIKAFKNHEYDILLGTQMVAKGLDFPDVVLVGVINADTSLNIPNFRSSENTFALLSQVAGRSGRSNKTGRVIIQTFNPTHYAINYAKTHDYVGFYKSEMLIRRNLKYPPFYYICYLRISSKNYDLVSKESNKIKKSITNNLTNSIILGPSPAYRFKVNNIYHFGITLKYKKEDNLYPYLNKLIEHYRTNPNITIDIDFNPLHF